eukprot:6478525-Lingulodinium_polyedra.AAC.1
MLLGCCLGAVRVPLGNCFGASPAHAETLLCCTDRARARTPHACHKPGARVEYARSDNATLRRRNE